MSTATCTAVLATTPRPSSASAGTLATARQAEAEQPSERELETLGRQLQRQTNWADLLPGLARLTVEEDEGERYALRIVKHAEAPGVRVVRPGEDGTEDAVSILKVSELARYKFGLKHLADQLKLNQYETRAIVHLLDLSADERYFKLLRLGKVASKRYSHEALKQLREAKLAGRLKEAKEALRQRDRERRIAPTGSSVSGRVNSTRLGARAPAGP